MPTDRWNETIRIRITYFPVEGQYCWAAWKGDEAHYIDTTFHPTRDAAALVARLLFGSATVDASYPPTQRAPHAYLSMRISPFDYPT